MRLYVLSQEYMCNASVCKQTEYIQRKKRSGFRSSRTHAHTQSQWQTTGSIHCFTLVSLTVKHTTLSYTCTLPHYVHGGAVFSIIRNNRRNRNSNSIGSSIQRKATIVNIFNTHLRAQCSLRRIFLSFSAQSRVQNRIEKAFWNSYFWSTVSITALPHFHIRQKEIVFSENRLKHRWFCLTCSGLQLFFDTNQIEIRCVFALLRVQFWVCVYVCDFFVRWLIVFCFFFFFYFRRYNIVCFRGVGHIFFLFTQNMCWSVTYTRMHKNTQTNTNIYKYKTKSSS